MSGTREGGQASMVSAHGKQFEVYTVFIEYAAWHRSPTGFYGWVREVGSKRRGVVTDACRTAADALAAAKLHVQACAGEKSLAQVLYEAEDLYSAEWASMSLGERSQYERMACAAVAVLARSGRT